MIIADLEDDFCEKLVERGMVRWKAKIAAEHIKSAADTLSEFGPKDGPRAGEYLRTWIMVVAGDGLPPAEAWAETMKEEKP
jgi:hypothetical protein